MVQDLMTMGREKNNLAEVPAELVRRLADGLQSERIVPRFVDSYVVEHGRHALQVHAALYRDLLELLRREALLAVTARALAPLDRLVGLALPHLAPGGVCLFPKGRNAADELTQARALWQMEVATFPSAANPESSILRLENIRHAGAVRD